MFMRLTKLALLLAATGQASPEDDVIVATMRLADEPSYHWSTIVSDNARTYTAEGRVLAGGYTWVRLPIVESMALRMSRSAEDTIEAVFKEPGHCMVRTPEGWVSMRDLPRRHHDWAEDNLRPYIPLRGSGNLVTRDGPRLYSNAQFAPTRPHDELAIIVSTYRGLQFEADGASGHLTNLGAQLLLVREGQEHLQPVIAAGRFRLWIQDGRVLKYYIEIEGVLLVDGAPCLVHQYATTVLDVPGSSPFEISGDICREMEL